MINDASAPEHLRQPLTSDSAILWYILFRREFAGHGLRLDSPSSYRIVWQTTHAVSIPINMRILET